MYKTDFWTLWEKVSMGCFERTALKHVYYLGWNRSPAQVGCMRQVLRPGALGRPRGIGWRGRQEGGSGWGIHVNLWLIHVNVWQNPLQYCKVISLQLIKINGEKNKTKQRIARRDKKALPSDQCKEIEENNRMGKTRDLFKKIRHMKETFQAKAGTIKDRNGMDITNRKY